MGPPDFSWTGSNKLFASALREAALKKIVLGMGAPAEEQNWFEGTRYGPVSVTVPNLTFARSGTGAATDPAVSFGPNLARREAGKGVRFHGARTNFARNSGYSGTVAGVIGSGAVAPTAGEVSSPAAGLQFQIIGVLTEAGQSVLRLRIFGTTTANSSVVLYSALSRANSPAATQTTILSSQFWLRLVSGTIPSNFGLYLASEALDASNVRQNVNRDTNLRPFLNATLSRFVRENITVSGGATTTKARHFLEMGWGNATAADFTIDIGANGFEVGPIASDIILNASTTASATIGADLLNISAAQMPNSGSILILMDLPPEVRPGVFQKYLDTPFGALLTSGNNQLVRFSGVGGASINLGTTSGPRRIALLATIGGSSAMSINGSDTSVGTDTLSMTGLANWTIGNKADGTEPANCFIGTLSACNPTNVPTPAQLKALSALS